MKYLIIIRDYIIFIAVFYILPVIINVSAIYAIPPGEDAYKHIALTPLLNIGLAPISALVLAFWGGGKIFGFMEGFYQLMFTFIYG